jgi:hypothetical protein
MGKMSVSVYVKRYYEEFCGFGQRKNKANQSQSPDFGRKSEARNPKSELRRVGKNSPICRELITSVVLAFSLIFIKKSIQLI